MATTRLLKSFCCLILWNLFSVFAIAETDLIPEKNTESIVMKLMQDRSKYEGHDKSRSFAPKVRGVKVQGAVIPPEKGIDLHLTFDFDSDRLTPDSRISLDSLAKAMHSPEFAHSIFVVVGHTDVVGTEEYNQKLSERRARSASDYLTRAHGISSSQLICSGRGKHDLADEAHPESGINRRVQFAEISE